MTTSPGPGTGSGTSSQRRTSGSPGSVMTTACIPSPLFGAGLRGTGVPTLSFPGCLLDREPVSQLSATTPVRWVSKSRVIWLTLGEMYEPGPHARPTHEDQEGRPVTMNNDTPQVFGEDTHDYPHDPAPRPDQDGEDFPPFRGWAGWGERVEPVAPDDDYPPPSFSPMSPRPASWSIRDGPARGGRVTRRVPAMRWMRATRRMRSTGMPRTWGSPRTRATRGTRASPRTWSPCR